MTFPASPRVKVIALAVASALMVGATLAVVLGNHRARDVAGEAPAGSAAAITPSVQPQAASDQQPISGQQLSAVDAAITRLQAVPAVAGSTSPEHPPVSVQARRHPDLYADAFVTQLLTHDYRSSRQALLSWVQSESAPSIEQTVVGLTPPALRNKMAVASVQDASGGPSPIPPPAVWATLGDVDGYTTVRVQRVFTPPTWTAAVAAGTVSDPGATAREVDADITLHTVDERGPKTSAYSVAITIMLEGPPTRDDYGFVTAVTFHVVDVE